jgi:F-type H+-transporting ATPase subunit c
MTEMLKLATMLVVLAVLATPTLAETATPATQPSGNALYDGIGFPLGKAVAIFGACIAAAGSALGGGLSISRLGSRCIEAMARQPEAAGSMFAPLIVTAAMVEGGMLFAMVVCLLGVLYI